MRFSLEKEVVRKRLRGFRFWVLSWCSARNGLGRVYASVGKVFSFAWEGVVDVNLGGREG